jgi:DNA polymerase Ligase (LigD)
MPRYVILDHDHPVPHFDFMLEAGDVLRTWRLLAEPAPGRPIAAEALANHRTAYLDYEGPVSGGRGRVMRWDAGSFEWQSETDAELRVRLAGGRCAGRVRLWRERGGWLWELTPGA